jgi:DNA-binding NarL/FixJ family response regulator
MPRSQKSETRSILIVDDHQLIRQSMAQLLRSAFPGTVVVEADTFADTLSLLADAAIFLAVVDLSIPGMAGPHDLSQIRRKRPDIRVVVLTGSSLRTDIITALEAGVHGYIVKNERSEQVIAHIRHVMNGNIYVPPSIAVFDTATTPSNLGRPSASLLQALTQRQKDVLRLITEGLSNKEIGRKLAISEGTVKMHVATTLRSIGASNRAHAASIGRTYFDSIASK